MTTEITVRWRARDGYTERRTYKTLKGARRFAEKWVGSTPEVGHTYAVDTYGIGTVTWTGCSAEDLFPHVREDSEDGTNPGDWAVMAEDPAETFCPECGGVETLDHMGGMSCAKGCRYG